jgi:hypothetical protein
MFLRRPQIAKADGHRRISACRQKIIGLNLATVSRKDISSLKFGGNVLFANDNSMMIYFVKKE